MALASNQAEELGGQTDNEDPSTLSIKDMDVVKAYCLEEVAEVDVRNMGWSADR